MIPLTPQVAAQITGGRWLRVPKDFEQPLVGAAFDSRRIGSEQIFFALNQGGVDGSRFIDQLPPTQIELAVVQQEVPAPEGLAVLWVPDSLKALHQLARWRAEHFGGKILSLTGSSGKTTTKTWLRHCLEPHLAVQSNPGSFNNHIGCPVTVLSLKPETELLILEMGTSGVGELELLCGIAPADVTLLLNVGHAHLGKFGSAEALLEAKLEIFKHQRLGGQAIVPGWDQRIQGRLPSGAWTFGPGSPRFARRLEAVGPLGQRFELSGPSGSVQVEVPHPGDYVGDLLAAVYAVFEALELPVETLADCCSSLPQERGRSTLVCGALGEQLLDDSYNANPESVVNMLQTLTSLKADRYIGVVGNLAEMDEGLQQSGEVILRGLPPKLTHLFLGGQSGQDLAPAIRQARPDLELHLFEQPLELLPLLAPLRGPGAVIGIKGSRSAHMERLTWALSGQDAACPLPRCGLLLNCADCPQLNAH
ncbi:MAG: Mur ligase family protein [bacterium]|nr:Mur ligase family protein [bacterium]